MVFNYNLPVNIVFGRGRINEIGKIVLEYGKNALIVTGTGSTKKTGLLDRAISYISEEKINVTVFDEVTQNPLTDTVVKGAEIAKENNCDVIIGIGGGSIMDCAKAIAFMSANNGDINDYIYNRCSSQKALPIVLVPTTCGTGSEGNGFAVLTNPENGDKKSLRSNGIIAKASIVDSMLMETMPKGVLASVGFDALCHCMEAFVSKNSQPIVEAMCIKGIEYINESLVRLYEGKQNDELWDKLSMASTIGGMVINSAGVGLPHAMEHPASGLKNIVHGQGLAALTPVIVDESYSYSTEKYKLISKLLGGSSEKDCSNQILNLINKLNLPTKLSALGIESKDIPWMSENCFKVSAASINSHPVLFSQNEIYKMYYQAF